MPDHPDLDNLDLGEFNVDVDDSDDDYSDDDKFDEASGTKKEKGSEGQMEGENEKSKSTAPKVNRHSLLWSTSSPTRTSTPSPRRAAQVAHLCERWSSYCSELNASGSRS